MSSGSKSWNAVTSQKFSILMGIELQLSMSMPLQLWALIDFLHGSQLIPNKKPVLHICISQVITPTYLQILSQSNKLLIFEYISLIQNVIKITEAYYILKAVCITCIWKWWYLRTSYFLHGKHVNISPFCQHMGSGAWLYCTWQHQYIPSQVFVLIGYLQNCEYAYHFANRWTRSLLLQETCIWTHVLHTG